MAAKSLAAKSLAAKSLAAKSLAAKSLAAKSLAARSRPVRAPCPHRPSRTPHTPRRNLLHANGAARGVHHVQRIHSSTAGNQRSESDDPIGRGFASA
jgi:hypothetical protein